MNEECKSLVSIIIACFNGAPYIEKCLSQLLNQTYSNIEIIVCDDCSKDDSFSLLKEYADKDSRIKLLHNSTSLKAGASRNRCIQQANGEYIAIQDIDDFSDITRIEKQVNFLNVNKNVDFVSSDAYLFSDDSYTCIGKMKLGKEKPRKRDFLWGPPFVHPATMFRAGCIKKVDGYRVAKETRRGQDYDMFMRMYAAGFVGENINECLYWYRFDDSCIKRHGKSGSRDEAIVRLNGFKMLGLLPWGYPFVLKPYIANFAHRLGWFRLQRKENEHI